MLNCVGKINWQNAEECAGEFKLLFTSSAKKHKFHIYKDPISLFGSDRISNKIFKNVLFQGRIDKRN